MNGSMCLNDKDFSWVALDELRKRLIRISQEIDVEPDNASLIAMYRSLYADAEEMFLVEQGLDQH